MRTQTPPLQESRVARPVRNHDVLVSIFVYNEGDRWKQTMDRFPAIRSYDLLVVDDGSTDGSLDGMDRSNLSVHRNERNLGLGASIKRAFRYALDHGYETIVILAGNGKDDPNEIDRLLRPILSDEADFVQGSRFLEGGAYGNMPFHRLIATKYFHPLLFSLLSGRRVSESTNGFRALRSAILRDPRIDWEQDWLDQYELEQYVHFKVVRFGYRRVEVAVSKVYPTKGRGYTKVKAITGWWSMIKPLVYLALGIRR